MPATAGTRLRTLENKSARRRKEYPTMHSKTYIEARKEFINCLCMSIIGLGVPIVLAFTEWWPIMKAEKQLEAAQKAVEA